MQAVKLIQIGQLALVDEEVPNPAENEILIKVDAAGICGTDRHLFKGEFPATPDRTLGHEFCGIVVDRGSNVKIPIGSRVTCDPNIWCGECDSCRRGRVNLCKNNIAVGIQRNGGFAEYCCFPAHKAHILPDTLHPHFGAFAEPLACTLHGIDIANPQLGERVTIIGGGVIGLLAVQLAKLAGAEVMLITRNKAKQNLALELGADYVASNAGESLRQWPHGADIVLECAGVSSTVEMAPSLTRTGGRVVVLGVLARGEAIPIQPFDLLVREINILFAFINPFTQERATRLIAEGKIRIAPLITRTASLKDAMGIISDPAPDGEIRCLITPNG